MSSLVIRDLTVRYGDTTVVDSLNLRVERGERVCLLGPSGCGKTTTLQAIGGFVAPEWGSIAIDGQDVGGLAPEKRNVAIMFQNYALFPHMTVFENVAFGLRMKRMPAVEIGDRVAQALERVRLAHAANRLPRMLSGGEQQRIAFARSVITEPRLLLLDEPFSNLDARLRHEMRGELTELLSDLKIATMVVTHDQEEAMALADRIVVMRSGVIEQDGTAHEIYARPRSAFVARFVGEANRLLGRVETVQAEHATVHVAGLGALRGTTKHAVAQGDEVQLFVRPQAMRLLAREEAGPNLPENVLEARIDRVLYLGHRKEISVRAGDHPLKLWDGPEADAAVAAGESARLGWRQADTLIYPL